MEQAPQQLWADATPEKAGVMAQRFGDHCLRAGLATSAAATTHRAMRSSGSCVTKSLTRLRAIFALPNAHRKCGGNGGGYSILRSGRPRTDVQQLVSANPFAFSRILALAASAAACARCLDPAVRPFTRNLDGCFCRTCQFHRAGIPGFCQLAGLTMISRLSSFIGAIWPIR